MKTFFYDLIRCFYRALRQTFRHWRKCSQHTMSRLICIFFLFFRHRIFHQLVEEKFNKLGKCEEYHFILRGDEGKLYQLAFITSSFDVLGRLEAILGWPLLLYSRSFHHWSLKTNNFLKKLKKTLFYWSISSFCETTVTKFASDKMIAEASFDWNFKLRTNFSVRKNIAQRFIHHDTILKKISAYRELVLLASHAII